MYSLLSVLLQREVGGDEGGEVKDELLISWLIFSAKKNTNNKKNFKLSIFLIWPQLLHCGAMLKFAEAVFDFLSKGNKQRAQPPAALSGATCHSLCHNCKTFWVYLAE